MAFFITKGQAQQMGAAYNQGFAERCFLALEAAAKVNAIGATMSTLGIGAGSVTVATTALQSAGWTVVADAPNNLLTIS